MKISLIICSYNPRKEWLLEAILSSISLFDETIVVDDGSAEPIELWLRGAVPDRGMKFIRNERNVGFRLSRNVGVRASTGDVIAFLDDDDRFIGGNLLEFKKFVSSNFFRADVWFFPVAEMDVDGNPRGRWGSEDLAGIEDRNCVPSGSWYRRECWDEVGGYRDVIAEDWLFWKQLIRRGKKFMFFPMPVYDHRMRPGQLSTQHSEQDAKRAHREYNENNG